MTSGETSTSESREAVVVTGAGRGIGRALTDMLVERGRVVIALDVDRAGIDAVGECHGERCLALVCDVASETDVAEAARLSTAQFPSITGLVNNAGVSAAFDIETMTVAQWEQFFAVDLRSCWLTTKHFLSMLRASAPSAIVNVSSIHARMTVGNMFPYAAAKSGVVGLTRCLALDLAPQGVRVNAVSPGWTRTRLVSEWFDLQPDPVEAERSVLEVHPMGRIAEPDEIAEAITFLLSPASSAITGAELPVDLGLSARFAT